MPRCAAFDPGLRNGGLAVFDSDDQSIVLLKRIDLLKPPEFKDELKFDEDRIHFLVSLVIQRHYTVLNSCDFCIVERQMGPRTKNICHAFAAAMSLLCPTLVIHPGRVKKFFHTSGKDHDDNKRLAINWCQQNLPQDMWDLVLRVGQEKVDDCCDSLMLSLFASRTIKDLMEEWRNPKILTDRSKSIRRTKMSTGGYAGSLEPTYKNGRKPVKKNTPNKRPPQSSMMKGMTSKKPKKGTFV